MVLRALSCQPMTATTVDFAHVGAYMSNDGPAIVWLVEYITKATGLPDLSSQTSSHLIDTPDSPDSSSTTNKMQLAAFLQLFFGVLAALLTLVGLYFNYRRNINGTLSRTFCVSRQLITPSSLLFTPLPHKTRAAVVRTQRYLP